MSCTSVVLLFHIISKTKIIGVSSNLVPATSTSAEIFLLAEKSAEVKAGATASVKAVASTSPDGWCSAVQSFSQGEH